MNATVILVRVFLNVVPVVPLTRSCYLHKELGNWCLRSNCIPRCRDVNPWVDSSSSITGAGTGAAKPQSCRSNSLLSLLSVSSASVQPRSGFDSSRISQAARQSLFLAARGSHSVRNAGLVQCRCMDPVRPTCFDLPIFRSVSIDSTA